MFSTKKTSFLLIIIKAYAYQAKKKQTKKGNNMFDHRQSERSLHSKRQIQINNVVLH
jgi:hypothetical protein